MAEYNGTGEAGDGVELAEFAKEKFVVVLHVTGGDFQQEIGLTGQVDAFHHLRHFFHGAAKGFAGFQGVVGQPDADIAHQDGADFAVIEQGDVGLDVAELLESPDAFE